MKHLIDVMAAATQQFDERIAAHLEAGELGRRQWAEVLSNQHHLREAFAFLIFPSLAHESFFRRPALRAFLLQFAHTLEIDAKIAFDDLGMMHCQLQPMSLEAELCISHFTKLGSERPFALIGALFVLTSLMAGSRLRKLISSPKHGRKCPAENLDRLGANAQRACPKLLEQVGFALPTGKHQLDLAEGASLARLFSLRMLDHDLGWNYAELFPLASKASSLLPQSVLSSLLAAS